LLKKDEIESSIKTYKNEKNSVEQKCEELSKALNDSVQKHRLMTIDNDNTSQLLKSLQMQVEDIQFEDTITKLTECSESQKETIQNLNHSIANYQQQLKNLKDRYDSLIKKDKYVSQKEAEKLDKDNKKIMQVIAERDKQIKQLHDLSEKK